MKERLEAMIGRAAEGVWLGTFHAIAARILRRHAEVVGLKSNFTILDTDDQLRLVKQLIAAANIDERRWPARALLGVIERWKDRGLTPDKVPRTCRSRRRYWADGRALAALPRLPGAARHRERGRFRRSPAAQSDAVHRRTPRSSPPISTASAICSSTNTRTPTSRSICGCGCWRSSTTTCAASATTTSRSIAGAAPRSATSCASRSDFPGRADRAAGAELPLDAANPRRRLRGSSPITAGRLGKTLWTDADDGDKVIVRGAVGRRSGGALGRRRDRGAASPRRGAEGDRDPGTRRVPDPRIRGALHRAGLPYRVVGGPRFYERQEIRDALAYLRLIHQPARRSRLRAHRQHAAARHRHRDACRRCMPPRAPRSLPLVDAARQLIAGEQLPRAARNALAAFLAALDRWREAAERTAAHRSHSDRARRIGLYRDVAGRQIARCAGPAGKPEGAGRRDGRIREPRRVSRTCQPGHGQRRRQRRRHGQSDDAAQRQGSRIRQRVPAGLGGGAVPEPALDRRTRARRVSKRSAASPMSG